VGGGRSIQKARSTFPRKARDPKPRGSYRGKGSEGGADVAVLPTENARGSLSDTGQEKKSRSVKKVGVRDACPESQPTHLPPRGSRGANSHGPKKYSKRGRATSPRGTGGQGRKEDREYSDDPPVTTPERPGGRTAAKRRATNPKDRAVLSN